MNTKTKVHKEWFTVFFIEDNIELWMELYRNEFEGKINILHAQAISEVESILNTNFDIDLIVLSGRENDFDTIPLIDTIRKSYTGYIIAASASESYRYKMVAAGCDMNIEKSGVSSHLRLMLQKQMM
jgi:DNA-binding response OmpR family regulator